jgi:hypothetical protein
MMYLPVLTTSLPSHTMATTGALHTQANCEIVWHAHLSYLPLILPRTPQLREGRQGPTLLEVDKPTSLQ